MSAWDTWQVGRLDTNDQNPLGVFKSGPYLQSLDVACHLQSGDCLAQVYLQSHSDSAHWSLPASSFVDTMTDLKSAKRCSTFAQPNCTLLVNLVALCALVLLFGGLVSH